MDPTTTLVTFMLQTSSDIHSVALIGSWDNFTKHYPMERDIRRARGQWRGCYAFEDIICDGDEGNGSRRSGGLKMGSTYYYYYEVDGATEHHDASLPFTTSCPFLPGQPVNLLSVPFEVEPPRDRSGSMSSIANGHVKTMNPADKFVTPRPPPQPPVSLQRIKTSPSIPSLNKKRSARSLSPQSEKPASAPWSRTFFGLRSAHAPIPSENNDRGRSASVDSGTIMEGDANIGYPVLISRSGSRKIRSVPQTRDVSPQSALVAQDILSRAPSTKTSSSSREISPVRQTFLSDNSSHHHNSFVVPDQIAEEEVEEDDDDNWATQFARMSFNNTEPLTSLSPAPSSSGIRSPPPLLRNSLDKPLPELPETPLMPSPLRVHVAPELLPRSHFSTSTISTDVTSPTDSNFGFSDTQTPSTSDFNDDYQEELNEENDQFTFTPMGSSSASRNFNGGFSGYSLPDGEYASEQTLRKQTPLSPGSRDGRITFGAGIGGDHRESLNALERFMNEMGYLGDHISGK